MKRMFVLMTLAYVGVSFGAESTQKPASTVVSESWVLVSTFLTSTSGGGSVGNAFQTFSTKERCEKAIQIINKQAQTQTNGWGKASFVPAAECTPQ